MLVTRHEFLSQLEKLKLRARWIFAVGLPLVLLLETPIVVNVLKVARAQPRSRETLLLSLLGFAACSVIVGIFYILIQRTIATYAPACPVCGARITWRERGSVLNSGLCPYCKGPVFPNV
jgi:hypothetical protein